MAFLNENENSIFLEIGDDAHKKLVRPLAPKPIAVWGHNIQSIETVVALPTGQPQAVRLRDFIFQRCTSTNRSGVGCGLCNRQDPHWHQLPADNQTNRKGQRVDFPRRPHYLMPVWSYADNAVKIMKGGNQVYEEMDSWDTSGRDIRECDWSVWKVGQKKTTKYHTQRQDATAFTIQVDQAVIEGAMKEALGSQTYQLLGPAELDKAIQAITPNEALANHLRANGQAAGLTSAPAQSTLPAASGLPALPPGPTSLPQANVLAGVTPEQIAAIAAALQAQQNTAPAVAAQGPLAVSAPVAKTGAVNPQAPVQTASTTSTPAQAQFTPVVGHQVVVPNATEVTSVLAQAQNVANKAVNGATSPSEYVLENGKYSGKSVGEVLKTDPEYLKFYRAYIKDEAVKAYITATLDAKPAMPAPAPTPAPSAPPTPAVAAAAADDKQALVDECKVLLNSFPEFKGKGLGDNMVPFIKSVIGRYDYTAAPPADLIKLREALQHRKSSQVTV